MPSLIEPHGQFILHRTLAGRIAPSRDWDALKHAYEQHQGELAALADANNITRESLQTYARKRGWRRFDAVPRPPPPVLIELPPAPLPDGRPPQKVITRQALDALLVRLFNAISVKLYQLETSMQDDKPLSRTDHERETRMIGSLTKNAEKVHELSRPGAGEADDAPKSSDRGKGPGHAEQVRRELAARIQKLRERPGE
jgi:hypothetical protein